MVIGSLKLARYSKNACWISATISSGIGHAFRMKVYYRQGASCSIVDHPRCCYRGPASSVAIQSPPCRFNLHLGQNIMVHLPCFGNGSEPSEPSSIEPSPLTVDTRQRTCTRNLNQFSAVPQSLPLESPPLPWEKLPAHRTPFPLHPWSHVLR
jgi:hypothetical protein